jgi:hypothetical protein
MIPVQCVLKIRNFVLDLIVFFICLPCFQRSVLTKLETLIEKHDETLAILRVLLSATRGVNENEMLEDILPSPLDSVQDLQELCSRLDDEEFRKKIVRKF